MMNCKEATRAIEKEAEGKLSFWYRLQLRLHLLMCTPCFRFKKHWDAISRFLNTTPGKSRLSAEDKRKIQGNIDDEILNL